MADATLNDVNLTLQENNKETKTLSERLSETKLAAAVRSGTQAFFGLDYIENFKKLGDKMTGIGSTISNKLDGLIVSPIKSAFSGIFDAIKMGIALIGGAIALKSFLEGWQNAEKWFGANPNFGEKISGALASVIQTFTGLDDAETAELAQSISKFTAKVAELTTSFFNFAGILSGMKEGDLGTAFTDLSAKIWENKELVIGALVLLNPGGAVRLAIWGLKAAFGLIGPALTAVSTLMSTTLLPAITAMGAAIAPMLIPAAAIAAVIALAVNTANALWESFKVFQDKFEETGSIMDALGAFVTEFIAQFWGWPAQLTLDAAAWIAGLFGFDDLAAKLDGMDPIQGIRDFLGWVGSAFTAFTEALANGYNTYIAPLLGDLNPIPPLLNFISNLTAFFNGIIEKVVNGWNYMKELFANFDIFAIGDQIGGMVTGIIDKIKGVIASIVNALIDKVNLIPGVNFDHIDLGSATETPKATKPTSTITLPETTLESQLLKNSTADAEKDAMKDYLASINVVTTVAPTTNNLNATQAKIVLD